MINKYPFECKDCKTYVAARKGYAQYDKVSKRWITRCLKCAVKYKVDNGIRLSERQKRIYNEFFGEDIGIHKNKNHKIRILESNESYKIEEVSYRTYFKGCQCIRDCTCHENFKSKEITFYRLTNFNNDKYKNFDMLSNAKRYINQIAL